MIDFSDVSIPLVNTLVSNPVVPTLCTWLKFTFLCLVNNQIDKLLLPVHLLE